MRYIDPLTGITTELTGNVDAIRQAYGADIPAGIALGDDVDILHFRLDSLRRQIETLQTQVALLTARLDALTPR